MVSLSYTLLHAGDHARKGPTLLLALLQALAWLSVWRSRWWWEAVAPLQCSTREQAPSSDVWALFRAERVAMATETIAHAHPISPCPGFQVKLSAQFHPHSFAVLLDKSSILRWFTQLKMMCTTLDLFGWTQMVLCRLDFTYTVVRFYECSIICYLGNVMYVWCWIR